MRRKLALAEGVETVDISGVRAVEYVRAFLRQRLAARGDLSQLHRDTGVSIGYLRDLAEFTDVDVPNPSLDIVDKLAAGCRVSIAQIFSEPNSLEDISAGTERDIGLTAPVLVPPHPVGVPSGEDRFVPYASSSSHLALYAIIGKLTEEQADTLTEAVLELVRRAQRAELPPPPKPKHRKS